MLAVQGHTYASGTNLPFWAVISLLRSGLESKGFDQVQIAKRSGIAPSQIPPIPPGSSDDWNYLISGRRSVADADLPLPAEVRWVVDTTPPAVILAGSTTPTAQPQPDASQPPFDPSTLPSWLPNPERTPSPMGPPVVDVPKGLGMPLGIGAGIIGGIFFAYQGMNHIFKEGLTAKERRGFLLASGVIVAAWAAVNLIGIDKEWFDPESVAGKIGDAVK